jgi:3',5'-cyclic AMP phosphodiesterase CpdA
MANHSLRQIRLIHVSDLHFGAQHQFQPPQTPGGSLPPNRGYPTLAASLRADLVDAHDSDESWFPQGDAHSSGNDVPVILAVTGDLTDTASSVEFQQAASFLPELGIPRDRTYVVPGNHDTIYTEPDVGRRRYPYTDFYGSLRDQTLNPREANQLTRVMDRSDPDHLIIAEVNSAFDVRKDTPEENRGHVDEEVIDGLRDSLARIPLDRRDDSIRIALVHHHPIVLPPLAEPRRGYDAMVNARSLLGVLRDFGFHLVLHGHKHFPHTFSYDAVCAWSQEDRHPLMVVAGGSAGSVELPRVDGATNTYNQITVKWNPAAREGRVRVVTRGLVRFDDRKIELAPRRWHWKSLRTDDRRVAPERASSVGEHTDRPYDKQKDYQLNEIRRKPYSVLRQNMLIAEVVPSLEPDQAYDVLLRIVMHRPEGYERPIEVEWTGGPNFPSVLSCDPTVNPECAVRLSYYGPMIVAARLEFADGASEVGTVYAHVPGRVPS